MAGHNGGDVTPREGEEASLLRSRVRSDAGDDRSSETLTDDGRRRGDEEMVDLDKPNQQVGGRRGLLIALSLWGLIFLQASNISGITTTQSKIAEDLDAYATASWFTSTYLIAMSSTCTLVAKLAQIFSPRICVFAASIFFAIGGVVTSQAQTLSVFLAGRAIQGIGGAGIITISFILVLELSGKKKRGLFIGLLNTGYTTGVSFGAVVAGALLPITGWRFLFWIQSPLGLIFGLGIFFSIPKSFTSGQEGDGEGSIFQNLAKLDYLGAFTLTTSLCLFLYGLSWPVIQLTPIMASIIVFFSFILIEVYFAKDPIIPITVLKSRGVLLSCIGQLGTMAARWMILFYTPTYAIAVRGWSPPEAGSILIPTNTGFAVGGLLVGGLHIKRSGSFWLPCLISYSCFSCTLLLLSQISNQNTPVPLYLLAVFVNGLCVGSALNYTLAHLLHLTPPSTHFISTSLLTTFRGFAGSFGSAIGGGVFVRVLKAKLEQGLEENGGLEGKEELVRILLGSPAWVKRLHGVEKMVAVESYVGALQQLFTTGAGLALAVVIIQAGTGWKSGEKVRRGETEGDEQSVILEDEEEWEEGLEQGV